MKSYFGNKLKLKDVTYKHIEDYYTYLRTERKNKNVTIKHHAVILSPALRMAYRDDLIPKNPYEFVSKLKREKSKRNHYNVDELEELFSRVEYIFDANSIYALIDGKYEPYKTVELSSKEIWPSLKLQKIVE